MAALATCTAFAAVSSFKVHRALCAMATGDEAGSGAAVRSALVSGGLSFLCGFVAAGMLP